MAGPNYPYTQLDQQQILQSVFETSTDRLRVDAEITAPLSVNGEVLVNVTAADGDSVLVYGTLNGTPTGTPQILKINSDGSLNVNVTNSSELTTYSVFNDITSVPNGVLTTILTYTVPTGKTDFLSTIEVSGDNMAQFEVYFNGTLNARRRTSLTEFNSQFNFLANSDIGLPLSAGTIVTVMVIQNRPDIGNYEARLVYAE